MIGVPRPSLIKVRIAEKLDRGGQAAEWGLAIEAPPAADFDDRAEHLLERIAAMPINQLMMFNLALNTIPPKVLPTRQ